MCALYSIVFKMSNIYTVYESLKIQDVY